MKVVKKEEYALNNKCPSCGASISYNPKSGKWDCLFCKSSFTLEELKKHNNASSDANNEDTKEEKTEDEATSYVSYKCKSCGAEIITDEQTAATFCIYCRNTTILKSKLSGEFKPDLVIPFKKEKKQSIEAFKNISKGRPLTPKYFNNESNIEKIRGVYIPFWLYDVNVSGDIEFGAQKIERWSSGSTHYVKTSNYNIKRDGLMVYEKIPKDASTRFDDDIMDSIEPFNYDGLEKYNHAYLSGFLAEKYDVDCNTSYDTVQKRALKTAEDYMLNDAKGYTSKVIKHNNLKQEQLKSYYALLPVWMVNVVFNNKKYLFAMNGQTGKFMGNIPIDHKKAFLYTIFTFISTFLLGLLVSYILYKVGA